METQHPAELSVLLYLQKAMAGEATMTEEVADKVASDIKKAMMKQFGSGRRDPFRLRMSNIGKPTCQLWFEKNQPDNKEALPPYFLMNMILGDIVEAVFKGLLTASGVSFEDNATVTLQLPDGQEVKGEYDMELDGRIDDVKSASPWSYNNKFTSVDVLKEHDSFGYVAQLVGYSVAANKSVGGWWAVNKANGQFKYVDASTVDVEDVMSSIQDTANYLDNDAPFERCFDPVPETFSRKATGNMVLPIDCKFCSFKKDCHPTLKTMPNRFSKAKTPPEVDYVYIGDNKDANY
jgi:hypothetical protein